jgi:hypothetical protein
MSFKMVRLYANYTDVDAESAFGLILDPCYIVLMRKLVKFATNLDIQEKLEIAQT